MRTSYSALETYKNCPQKYKYQEVDRIRVPKSKEALFGTAVHDALHYMFEKDPLFPTLDEVLARFREKITAGTIPEGDKQRYAETGLKMIEKYYKKNPPWNFNVVNLESHFEMTIDDPVYSKAHVLAGKIDRIDKKDNGIFEIIDYKTSKKLPSQNDVDNNLQLTVYNLAVLKKWPHREIKNIELSLYFIKAGEKISTARTRETLAVAQDQILDTIHSIENKLEKDDFSPTPSVLCDWCGYKKICPAWRHLYEKESQNKPISQDDIDDIVNEYIELKNDIAQKESRVKELSGSINAYLDEKKLERLFGKNSMITRSGQERISWDIEKVKEIVEPLGLWEKLFEPNEKKVKSIINDLPRNARERLINEARRTKTFSMLKVSKRNSDS